ncbi:MAG: hypothetical protein KR126chlam6_01470 [Candidatus Anoxychlamydiales bacterium]|nr:hypothetical protein [Candidatus Anoxychlamydiales bacterium]
MLRLTLLFLCFVTYLFPTPLQLDINAKNAILINADNGAVLFEKKADEIIYPASITKVFSLWYIVENYIDLLNRKFEASKNALYVVEPQKKITSNKIRSFRC